MFGRKKNNDSTSYWIQKTHLFRRDEFICASCGCVADKAYVECPSCGCRMKKCKYDASWVDEAEMMDIFLED